MVSNSLPVTSDQVSEFASLCGGKTAKILVLNFERDERFVRDDLVIGLSKAGFTDLSICNFPTRADLQQKDRFSRLVTQASGLMIAGKAPTSLFQAFDREWCQKIFSKFIDHGGTWFGIGPPASVIGDRILTGEKTEPGLSLFDGIITVDYYAKHQELPLRNAYFSSRLQHGIGLNQGEWMVFRDVVIEKKVGSPQVFLRE